MNWLIGLSNGWTLSFQNNTCNHRDWFIGSEGIMEQETTTIVQAPDKDARNWAMICHLAALSGYMIPFGNILGPLIIWVLKKDDNPFIDDQGKEVLNFQLTMTIGFIVSGVLVFILIGFFLVVVLAVYVLIMTIVGAINANDGKYYRYPLTLRFFN